MRGDLEDMSWPSPPITAQEDEAWERLADLIAARLADAPDDRPLLTIQQVAERLAISPRTARDLTLSRGGEEPRLRSVLVADGARRVLPADLDAYVEARRC